MRKTSISCLLSWCLISGWCASTAAATTYYVSTQGNDTHTGLSESDAFATFDRAFVDLYPGDTLILMDGTYRQSLRPDRRNGKAENPIAIRAQHDGKVVIDGDNNQDGIGDFVPVQFGGVWAGPGEEVDPGESPVGNYFILEGIVAKNGAGQRVYEISGEHNVLRRDSGYNASTDENSAIFGLLNQYNLVEDCVAAGTGRKMIYTFGGQHNIFRRCFSAWTQWRGGSFCPGPWPWGDNIESYNGSNNIIENCIAFGRAPTGIKVFSQGGAHAGGNKVLGSISLRMGLDWNGGQLEWPCPPPAESSCTSCADFAGNDGLRKGFALGDQFATQSDNLFQDIFAWGNGGLGFHVFQDPGQTNNRLVRATLVHNGLGNPIYFEIANQSILERQLGLLSGIFDSFIEHTSYQGGGARLVYRYVTDFNNDPEGDGTLRDGLQATPRECLWPWPMEDRIRDEFLEIFGVSNFSVTGLVYPVLLQYHAVENDTPGCTGPDLPESEMQFLEEILTQEIVPMDEPQAAEDGGGLDSTFDGSDAPITSSESCSCGKTGNNSFAGFEWVLLALSGCMLRMQTGFSRRNRALRFGDRISLT